MYAIIQDGYVTEFGLGNAPKQGIEINESQYALLRDSFKNCPKCDDGYVANLNLYGTWDIVEGEETDIDDETAFNII